MDAEREQIVFCQILFGLGAMPSISGYYHVPTYVNISALGFTYWKVLDIYTNSADSPLRRLL